MVMNNKDGKMHRYILITISIMAFLAGCDLSRNDGFEEIPRGGGYKPLGADFDPFSTNNSRANLVFYISVNRSVMDTSIDSPAPSLTVPAVEYTPCLVTVSNTDDGKVHVTTDTLIRYKGNTTFDKPKPQFRLKYDDDNEFYGYRRLNLHSEWKDATLMREKLVYDFMQHAGVKAPRANHVRVYVDEDGDGSGYSYYGLYTLVEAEDKIFLKHTFGSLSNTGNLYKMYYGVRGANGHGFATLQKPGSGSAADYRGGNGFAKAYPIARAYRLKTNEELYMEDYTDLAALVNTINSAATGTTYKNQLSAVMDVEGFLNWLAVNTLVGGWDNYWKNQQNYYLYNLNNTGYWYWTAWDYDNSLGNNFQDHNGFHIESEDIFYSSHADNVLIHKVLAVPAWRTWYTNRLQELISGYFNSTDMNVRIDTLKAIIQPYAQADTLKQYNNTLWAGNIDSTIVTDSDENGVFDNQAHHLGIRDYIAQRVSSVQGQLGGGFAANYLQMYLRGSAAPTEWATPGTSMSLIADNVWSVTVSGVIGGDVFKFAASPTDWSVAWGDQNTDGVADMNPGGDIPVTVSGTVTFTFNDDTWAYTQSN